MVKERVGSLVWLRKRLEEADTDLLREMVKTVAEVLMATEASAVCGAPYRQPSADRVNQRNGYRERRWNTQVGTIDLAIPKLRKGTYCPEWLLEPRRRGERALMQDVTELSWMPEKSPCWLSNSLPDQQEDGAMPLHHLTGRDLPG